MAIACESFAETSFVTILLYESRRKPIPPYLGKVIVDEDKAKSLVVLFFFLKDWVGYNAPRTDTRSVGLLEGPEQGALLQ